MLNDILDERILHVRRIGHSNALVALTGLQADGVIVEHGEADLPLSANDLNTILAGAFVGHIAPRATARQAVLETEAGTHRILGLIVATTIGTDASGFEDDAEHILQEVELMGSHIVEIATSCNLGLESPRQWCAVLDGLGIGCAQRFGITYLHVDDLSDAPAIDDILHLLEIRQVTAVISHETRDTRLLGNAVDTGTVLVAGSQRLLDIDGFAGLHGHNGVSGVTRWRSSHINGVHVRIIDQLLRISVPFSDAVLDGIGTRTLLRTAHHSLDARALDLAESRSTLTFGYLTATYKTPP